jgi:hypothetical protein
LLSPRALTSASEIRCHTAAVDARGYDGEVIVGADLDVIVV